MIIFFFFDLMKSYIKIKPRVFTVGNNKEFSIKDYGSIHLNPNEQISFLDNENCGMM